MVFSSFSAVAISEFENGDLFYRKAQNDNPIDISSGK